MPAQKLTALMEAAMAGDETAKQQLMSQLFAIPVDGEEDLSVGELLLMAYNGDKAALARAEFVMLQSSMQRLM